MADLQTFVEIIEGNVLVITNDGRCLVGTLKGYDNMTNLVLSDAHERLFSTDEPLQMIPLGLYMVRGDTVALIGSIDVDVDAEIDWESIKTEPLNAITH